MKQTIPLKMCVATAAQDGLPLMLLSFMGESRRLQNRRLKDELRMKLLYPTVSDGLVPYVVPAGPVIPADRCAPILPACALPPPSDWP